MTSGLGPSGSRSASGGGGPLGVGAILVLTAGIVLVVLVSIGGTLLPLFTSVGEFPLGWLVFYLPFVVPFVIIGMVGAVVWYSVARSTEVKSPEDARPDPLDVLEEQYVDGRLSIGEYEHRLERLFELEDDLDVDPRLEQLAIQYARGGLTRRELEGRVEALDSDASGVVMGDLDGFLDGAFGRTDPGETSGTGSTSGERPTALERLRIRYAEGKLDDEAYARKRGILLETEMDTEDE